MLTRTAPTFADVFRPAASRAGWTYDVMLVAMGLYVFLVFGAYSRLLEGQADLFGCQTLASHPIGRLVLLALIALPLWNGAHHLRHFLIDLGGYERDAALAPLLYAGATALSVVAIAAVVRL